MMYVFSFYDTKTGVYNTPFFQIHPGAAVRIALDIGTDMNTTIGRHPADYHLYQLGTFNDATGTFSQDNSINLGSVLSLLPVNKTQGDLKL